MLALSIFNIPQAFGKELTSSSYWAEREILVETELTFKHFTVNKLAAAETRPAFSERVYSGTEFTGLFEAGEGGMWRPQKAVRRFPHKCTGHPLLWLFQLSIGGLPPS